MVPSATVLLCGLALLTTSASTGPPPSTLVLVLMREQGGPLFTEKLWRDAEGINEKIKSLADKMKEDNLEQFRRKISELGGITCQHTCTAIGGCITTEKKLASSIVFGSCLPQSLGGMCAPPALCSTCNTVITCKEP